MRSFLPPILFSAEKKAPKVTHYDTFHFLCQGCGTPTKAPLGIQFVCVCGESVDTRAVYRKRMIERIK